MGASLMNVNEEFREDEDILLCIRIHEEVEL